MLQNDTAEKSSALKNQKSFCSCSAFLNGDSSEALQHFELGKLRTAMSPKKKPHFLYCLILSPACEDCKAMPCPCDVCCGPELRELDCMSNHQVDVVFKLPGMF